MHGDVAIAKVIQVPIDDQHLMALSFQQAFRIPIFERQVWLTATEIDAALKAPMGIQQGVLHDATSLIAGQTANGPRDSSSH